jgi:glycosyltransferase involved in cell wall biosynthesis
MKILQLCNKPPYPPVDGGTMAMNSVTQGLLREGCEVKVLTVESDKHPLHVGRLPEAYREATGIESVYVDLRVKPLQAAVDMFYGESYHVERYISVSFTKKLKEVLKQEEFDVVHVESVFLTPYVPLIRRHSNAKVILRAHNVEHLIWRGVAQSTRHGLKRWYLKHLALTLRAYEVEHVNDYDGVVCITQRDADWFRTNGCRRPLTVVPFGVAPTQALKHSSIQAISLYHLGAMDWTPNLEGVEWFLDEVWPVVHREVPQARLFLAGRQMPERLLNAAIDGVTVVGEVPDACQFIADKQVNIVPLHSGSGLRIKIIEAMSMGKAVVSTTVGASGIDCTDGEHLLIADTPEQFARQIGRLAADGDLLNRVGEAAAKLVADKYDEKKLSQHLIEFYKEIIKR